MEDDGSQNPPASITWDDGIYSTIRRFVVYEREWICSIQIEYDENGESVWSPTHGENEGSMSEVVLDYPDEYLVSISGYYGSIRNWEIDGTVIRSLTLETNTTCYGPFGVEDGKKISFPLTRGKIIGLHGISGRYLNAIGVHVQTIQKIGLQPEPPPKHLNMGQYGGKGGDPWEVTFQTIRQLRIYHGLWIDSFQIQYEDEDENQTLVWSEVYGGVGGFLAKVALELDEHFVLVEGYYSGIYTWGIDAIVIRSLTLKTNKRTYGPFGIEDGTKFSFPFQGLKLVGFHGRSSSYLDAIGLYVRPTQINGVGPEKFSLGEYGGEGGDPWEVTFQTIRQLRIYHGLWIDSFQIQYEDEDENQTLVWSEVYGGVGGFLAKVALELDEHFVLVEGYYSGIYTWGHNAIVIRSLTLKTNKRTYGPFGIEDGTKFSFPFQGLKLVGFHGRSSSYLDAIGLYVRPTQINGVGPEKFSLGECGGEGGDPWEVTFQTIRQLRIYHGLWIDSFQIQYEDEDENQTLVWSEVYGGVGGFLAKVALELDEHFVLVEGYYSGIYTWGIDATVIRSLTLKTNKRTYGPFGIEDGTKFSFPFQGLKLVGFHGRSSLYLDAIGLYVRPIQINGVRPEKFSLGECGGKGGDPWEVTFQTIRYLKIYHGLWIDSFQIKYEDKDEDENQTLVLSKVYGGVGGFLAKVALELDEHFVLVEGYYSGIHTWGIDATVIRSLTLKTNKRTYGPFGIEDGTKFSFPFQGLKLVGFHGRSSLYLDAIGLYVRPTQRNGVGHEKFSLGECGGEGGDPWDENFRTIRKLVINHGQWIDSIQMKYEDEHGVIVWSEKHGGNGGSQSKVVLGFPNEHLVTIHGYYDDIRNLGFDGTVIRSLTLETNKRSYGPFGVENGTKFSFPSVGVKIIGIHGRSGLYLDAIGLLALPIQD